MGGMAVRLYPEDERRSRSRAILAAHEQWVDGQLAKGLDGTVPPGRPDPSDYNVHVPDMEASGEALDELFGAMP